MVANSGYSAYRNSQVYDGMDPNRLIFMLYEGAVKFLKKARQGIEENDIPKRGENLSKAIAIVSELNSCLDSEINDEPVEFVRGLYASILTELPKVSITNDIKTVDIALSYIVRLKEIWEKDVMGVTSTEKNNSDSNIAEMAIKLVPSGKKEPEKSEIQAPLKNTTNNNIDQYRRISKSSYTV